MNTLSKKKSKNIKYDIKMWQNLNSRGGKKIMSFIPPPLSPVRPDITPTSPSERGSHGGPHAWARQSWGGRGAPWARQSWGGGVATARIRLAVASAHESNPILGHRTLKALHTRRPCRNKRHTCAELMQVPDIHFSISFHTAFNDWMMTDGRKFERRQQVPHPPASLAPQGVRLSGLSSSTTN